MARDMKKAKDVGMIDQSRYRDAMARLGGAVSVVTTGGPAGLAGFTATAVCSVTDSPPTLLVCHNRASGTHELFAANGVLCVNLLSAAQQAVSDIFATRGLTPSERFAAIAHHHLTTGSPAIVGALANFDCRIISTRRIGTHDVHFCEIVDLRRSENGDGLIWFDRGYHLLPGSTPPTEKVAPRDSNAATTERA